MTVEVRVSEADWHANEISSGMEVLRRLRNAGVPAVGNIWPYAVERGTLSVTRDEDFEEFVWTWQGE